MIQTLEPAFADATAALLEAAILESPYYSAWAKSVEITGLSAANLQAMPKDHVLIFLKKDKVLGALVMSGYEAGLLWLAWVAVLPKARKRGIAGQLIEAFHQNAATRGVHKTWCDSRIGNAASQKMLEKAGYKVVATLEKHWYGLDYWIWEKSIDLS